MFVLTALALLSLLVTGVLLCLHVADEIRKERARDQVQ